MKLTPPIPLNTPSTRGLPTFYQKPEQLTMWMEEAGEVTPAVWASLFCEADPIFYYVFAPLVFWPFLNKRFTEVQ